MEIIANNSKATFLEFQISSISRNALRNAAYKAADRDLRHSLCVGSGDVLYVLFFYTFPHLKTIHY